MTSAIHDRLAAQFDSYSVERQIHDVPPHEVYEVTVDGQRAVYKANTGLTGSAELEGRVFAFLDRETTLPVPEPLYLGEEYYVAAWHPDAPSPDKPQDAESWAEPAGKAVARLHDETASRIEGYGQLRPADGGIESTGYGEFHSAAIEYVQSYQPTLQRFGHGDVAEDVLAFLRDNPDRFAGTDEAVLCHGWATPEHVSIVDGDVGCLVDFEHAIAAPGEFDVWRTVGSAFGQGAGTAAFRRGYESVRALPDGVEQRKQAYELLNGVYFFVSLYVQDQHDEEKTAQLADQFRERVSELLADLD